MSINVEVDKILDHYSDTERSRNFSDLKFSLKVCNEKCASVPSHVELAEHHYGMHLEMLRKLLVALRPEIGEV